MAKKTTKKTGGKKAKKTTKKAGKSAKKPAARAKPAAKKAPARPKAKAARGPKLSPEKIVPGGTYLGPVEDYFAHVGAIAVTLRKPLSAGDTIRVKGHTTDVIQKVESIQINHAVTQTASRGDSVGIKIADRARKGDAV